jgi:hypothetical protein
MTHPFNSYQLKDIADTMEACLGDHLWPYNVAASNTKESHRLLYVILRDDEKRELILSDYAYKNVVESRTKFFAGKAPSRKREIGAISCV